MIDEILIFFLITSIIFLLKEIYSFVQHLLFVQRFHLLIPSANDKYEISLPRQFGILFTISYIITYIIV